MNKYEWFLVGLFALTLIVNLKAKRLRLVHMLFLLVFYTGVEFATQGAWQYNPAFDASMFTFRHHDVNVIVALGWVSMIGLGLSLGESLGEPLARFGFSALRPFATLAGDILGVGLVGISVELFSVLWGMFSYQPNFWTTLGMANPIWVGPLPLTVVAGYFLTGWFAHGVAKYLR